MGEAEKDIRGARMPRPGERPQQKHFMRWWEATIQIFLTREGLYEAQVNKDDGQFRGTGRTPKEAIIDALDVDDRNFG
jgi:hypothetical protein